MAIGVSRCMMLAAWCVECMLNHEASVQIGLLRAWRVGDRQ